MKYSVAYSNKFKKDYKLIVKQGKDIAKLQSVVEMLAEGEQLPPKFKDHNLAGEYDGYRECHIEPDWLLIYEIDNQTIILTLTRTGSHSELFD